MKFTNRYDRRQRGLSLIEVMVAMVIGLILMAGVGYVYLSGKRSYNVQSAAATVQENGRFALDFMRPEIRMAGFFGCGASSERTVNDLNVPASVPWYENIQTPLVGYEGGVSTFPTLSPSPLPNTDAITVLRGDSHDQYLVTHQQTGGQASFTLNNATDLIPGQILVVTDCSDTAVFQMTGNNGQSNEVVHNTGNTVVPGNCSKLMGTDGAQYADCNSTSNLASHIFQGSGSLMPVKATIFYVADVPNVNPKEPALYEAVLAPNGAGGTQVLEKELVDGVENLQILYGVAPAIHEAPVRYVTANNVANWGDVVEVRISLLARSSGAVLPTAVSTSFGGQTYDDKYLRRVFDASIAVRNRDAG